MATPRCGFHSLISRSCSSRSHMKLCEGPGVRVPADLQAAATPAQLQCTATLAPDPRTHARAAPPLPLNLAVAGSPWTGKDARANAHPAGGQAVGTGAVEPHRQHRAVMPRHGVCQLGRQRLAGRPHDDKGFERRHEQECASKICSPVAAWAPRGLSVDGSVSDGSSSPGSCFLEGAA